MRILLVAEGQHELHGALESLVRRLLPDGTAVSEVVKLPMKDSSIGHLSGSGDKFTRLTKRILFVMRHAIRLEFDALVLLIDEDGYRDRRRSVNEAQDSTMFPIQRAIGIAIQAFDAWMLADETAISKALNNTIPCQPAPEDLARPKDFFKKLHQEAASPLSLQEAYAQIAEKVRMDILVDRCPNGFAPFAHHVKQLH